MQVRLFWKVDKKSKKTRQTEHEIGKSMKLRDQRWNLFGASRHDTEFWKTKRSTLGLNIFIILEVCSAHFIAMSTRPKLEIIIKPNMQNLENERPWSYYSIWWHQMKWKKWSSVERKPFDILFFWALKYRRGKKINMKLLHFWLHATNGNEMKLYLLWLICGQRSSDKEEKNYHAIWRPTRPHEKQNKLNVECLRTTWWVAGIQKKEKIK